MATTDPSGVRRASRGVSAAAGRRTGAAALLLTPFLALFAVAVLAPIGYALWLSLFRQQSAGLGFGGRTTVFAGLADYTSALSDQAFRSGFAHVAEYALLYVPVMLAAALAVAMLLDSTLARAKRFFQLTLFLPHAVPGIIAAMVWAFLYTPQVSPVVHLLRSAGLPFDLGSAATAVPAMANIGLWEALGYNVIIFYAALQALPRELTEAAVLDGAGQARIAWSVKLPLIRSSLGLVGLFTAIGVLQLFNEPLLLSQNGAGAVSSRWTPNMYNYAEAFHSADYGRAAAGSLLLALVSGVLSFAITRWSKPWRTA